ncbi:hypothetical protein PREVCOP_06040 [Segatella copri DSM 18205]|uniref:Uncharacterized protein n=1 Tax=Segatella copri DSM 18205 TaxID=537011 RepID=D1PFN1_9BACT|nr:hypothetical protein PREVCOP_06040 [Segatella copri DSM 18205]
MQSITQVAPFYICTSTFVKNIEYDIWNLNISTFDHLDELRVRLTVDD